MFIDAFERIVGRRLEKRRPRRWLVTTAVAAAVLAALMTASASATPTTVSLPASQDCTLERTVASQCAQQVVKVGVDCASGTSCSPASSARPNRGLFAFDVSSIPRNAQITSASLRLVVLSRVSFPPASVPVDISPVTMSWTNAATWTTSDGTVPWTGGAYAASPSATGSLGAPGSYTFDVRSIVEPWVRGISPNYGFEVHYPLDEDVITRNAESIASRENTTSVASRPSLTITYDVLPDTTPPEVYVEGVPYDDRATVVPKDLYRIAIDADDPDSGVADVRVLVDGTQTLQRTQSCPQGGCGLEIEDALIDARGLTGVHHIDVVATDVAANARTVSWDVQFDGVPNPPPPPDGAPEPLRSSGFTTSCPDAVAGVGAAGDPAPSERVVRGHWQTARGATAGETTTLYAGGSYRVTRCNTDGTLAVSQFVVTVQWKGFAPARFVLAELRPTGVPGELKGAVSLLPPPDDEGMVGWWGAGGAAKMAARVIPPTRGRAVLPPAGAPAADPPDPTPCDYKHFERFGPRLAPNTYSLQFTFNPDTLPAFQPGTNIPYDQVRFKRRLISGANTWSWGRNRCGNSQSGGVDLSLTSADTTARAGVKDGSSVIDLGGNPSIDTTCPPDVLACSTFWVEGDVPDPLPGSGTITESDIRFNVRYRFWTGIRLVPDSSSGNIYDLWSLAAHEMGHSIGIAHPSEDPNAPNWVQAQVMYYSFGDREERRYLKGSDYEAMCRLYPCF